MLQLAIISARSAELSAILRPRLADDLAIHCHDGSGPVPASVLEAQVVLGAPDLTAPLVGRMPRLRWVQSTWAGVRPFIDAPRRDYLLTGVKGIFGDAMAEYVLGWALALKRSMLRHATSSCWDATSDPGLGTLKLGIAGIGSIGAAVARRCEPFFASVRGLNRDGRPVVGVASTFAREQRLQFAEGLDVLVLLLPDTAETRVIVDGSLLARLNRGAVLINGGRANALDLSAALAALESGQLSAAVLDVLEREPLPDGDPLWNTANLYITSHTAAPTDPGAVAELFLENLARYRRGEDPVGLIDFTRGY